jgi:hypothetical protein
MPALTECGCSGFAGGEVNSGTALPHDPVGAARALRER